ncbi:MAG: hypothetical protein KGL21_09705, partial [Alphaproteobacteria bacterium]|nr:hypothetical protein [Alphaproteobacteria bacterium]
MDDETKDLGKISPENVAYLAQIWSQVRASLRADIGARGYDQWLKPAALLGYCEVDGVVRLALPSAFMASWVRSHYLDRLSLTWRHFMPSVSGVRVEVSASVGTYAVEAGAAEGHATDQRREVSKPVTANRSRLNPKFTFASFVIGLPNTIAANAAHALAEGGPMRFNPLYIQGATGQ